MAEFVFIMSKAEACVLQLSYGLSTEYAKKPQASEEAKFNAERQLYSKYYISQILQMGEEGIHDAWSKVDSFQQILAHNLQISLSHSDTS